MSGRKAWLNAPTIADRAELLRREIGMAGIKAMLAGGSSKLPRRTRRELTLLSEASLVFADALKEVITGRPIRQKEKLR